MARLAYDIVDVFTDRPFAGNPLAVVHGAGDLTSRQLQALAAELNLSETTFPSAPVTGGDYSVRIFTPGSEVPFAGHPTLGTAWLLQQQGRLAAGPARQECGAGLVEVTLPDDPGGIVRLGAAPRDLPAELDGSGYAEAVGLSWDDLAGPVLAAGCGLTFVHVPVKPGAVERARAMLPGHPVLRSVPGTADPVGGIDVYATSESEAADLRVHARVFCPELAVPEDPATGSSAAGLGLVLHARDLLGPGRRYGVSQGAEMGRPSLLVGEIELGGSAVRRCHVGGGVAHVASGEIAVPPL